ncbi:Uma2 family endonuclease [Actinomadura parmotrematis]|uniref:Uma2 family endonuclease n=1 Tax=Actinomadura parmotrematis TaxID=2864039 RepID=A0ABS7FTB6_9ACTN|nr:Uma2 family endonuclease [Actinomadura parmotrematis]MBW8483556.1 Uma2 family endonuclease [Actinomadura parmotrematis]
MTHTLLHQVLVSDLVVPVGLAELPGQESLTGFGARVSDDTWLRCDLMVYRKEQARGDLWYIRGAPLLAVEVASDASRGADLRAKKDLYERFAVPSYWVVDLRDDEPEVQVYELGGDGRYAHVARAVRGGPAELSRPFPIRLDLDDIFDRLPSRSAPRRPSTVTTEAAPQAGPDLPHREDPFLIDAFGHRWPTGAEKVELWDGCPVFYGVWDARDVEIAERAYPGRVVRLDQPPGDPGTMTILPAPAAAAEDAAAG